MNFEKGPVENSNNEEERLTEEQAHNVANTMRAVARISPESGKVEKPGEEGQEVTKETYDAALVELERLKEEAKKDPKALEKLAHNLGVVMAGVSLPLEIARSVIIKALDKTNPFQRYASGSKDEEKSFLAVVKEKIVDAKEALNEDVFVKARRILEAEKAEGKRFGEHEVFKEERDSS